MKCMRVVVERSVVCLITTHNTDNHPTMLDTRPPGIVGEITTPSVGTPQRALPCLEPALPWLETCLEPAHSNSQQSICDPIGSTMIPSYSSNSNEHGGCCGTRVTKLCALMRATSQLTLPALVRFNHQCQSPLKFKALIACV